MASVNYLPRIVQRQKEVDFSSSLVGATIDLDEKPAADTTEVFRNGVKTKAGNDFTISNKTVTLLFPVRAGRTRVAVRYGVRR